MIIRLLLFLFVFIVQLQAQPPNIILIMTDDSGYSDLACYGGEIDTPNLDRLAHRGLRFRNFYNNGRCSPTRASLMTGRDSAHVGFAAGTLGGWKREMKMPAYRARLPYAVPTIAELLRNSGYQTMMTGKWHLGGSHMRSNPAMQLLWKRQHPGWELTDDELDADFKALPPQRGFDHFFGMIGGEDHLFFTPSDPHPYYSGNQVAKLEYAQSYNMHCYYEQPDRYPYTPHHGQTAKAFYGTDGMTDRSIDMIEEAMTQDAPFFLYMAYRAPHLPIQAPQELVDKYLPRYQDLSQVEASRVEGLVREGLWDRGMPYRQQYAKNRAIPAQKRADLQRKAAIHAAMMEKVDMNVGRVISTLERGKALDNTLIIYLSDNGAAAHLGALMNTPYHGNKALMWEGGTKTHCIMHWPEVIAAGRITDAVGWVGDIVPTCLEIIGAAYPRKFRGSETAALDGRSLLPILRGEALQPLEYLFANDKGQQSVIYQERWKLLVEPGWHIQTSQRPGIVYELYDLWVDPAEVHNVAEKYPEIVHNLQKACVDWQRENSIVDYNDILSIRPDHRK